LVNSRLVAYVHYSSSPKARKGAFPKILVNDVRNLPIRKIDFNIHADKKKHDDIVSLVQVMLDIHKKLHSAKGNVKDQIQRQIEKTDKEIDDLVYKLYGITDEERKIIEECG